MAAASPDPFQPAPERIGPGRLVLVVGPSGAGKDSLLKAARDALAGDAHYVFPRRLVTRPASPSEDNAEITGEAFEDLCRDGAFAVSWSAHGLGYGIPKEIDQDIGQGRTVLCNVSRSVVGALRGRYANTLVVEVTAPPEVLRHRLASRGRTDDGPLDGRLARTAPDRDRLKPDIVVCNDGPLPEAVAAFLRGLASSACNFTETAARSNLL